MSAAIQKIESGDLAGLLRPGLAGNPVAAVHAKLAASDQDGLLIFDDGPAMTEVRDALPPAGPGRVLIATQDARWPGGGALDVAVLELDAAAGFVLERTGSAEVEAARELLARADPAGYDNRVATTWARAFDQLVNRTPGTAGRTRGGHAW